MPELMLRKDWPGKFRRTIKLSEKKREVLEFVPGVPVELNARQIDGVKGDIGTALYPVERDGRNKVRVITDEVDAPEVIADGSLPV
jgi:hypothetical protein